MIELKYQKDDLNFVHFINKTDAFGDTSIVYLYNLNDKNLKNDQSYFQQYIIKNQSIDKRKILYYINNYNRNCIQK